MAARVRSPEAMSELVVFDTSIVVDQNRTNRHLDRILRVQGLIRNSSVVLAELWRGAASAVDRKTIEGLERSHATLTPTANNWLESGHLLAKIRDDKGFEPHKLRDLHFDVLIALTARSHGARLITSNRADFELIRKYRNFKLEVW
jgi:predicted nucleic acid-binding protein